jgi:NADPH:quinone reductase-like Zn-dependent oxidoreductase
MENAGKRIVVVSAAGGVGVWLLQLAKEAGVGSVVVVCGTDNVKFVKELGAARKSLIIGSRA